MTVPWRHRHTWVWLLLGGLAQVICGLLLAFRGSYDGVFV